MSSSDAKALISKKKSVLRSLLVFFDFLLQKTFTFLYKSHLAAFPSPILLPCLAYKTWKRTYLFLFLQNFPFRRSHKKSADTFVKNQYLILQKKFLKIMFFRNLFESHRQVDRWCDSSKGIDKYLAYSWKTTIF